MSERPTRSPEIPLRTLGGLNERPSPANLRPGEFDILEGLYPSRVGLLSRIPGKTLLSIVGTDPVLQIRQTFNPMGDVLIQCGSTLSYYTLDELLNRGASPALTFTPIEEEETMSMAILVQSESNTQTGGSIQGYLTGTDSGSAADTWYPRRITSIAVDADGIVTGHSYAGSGSGAASSGSFDLGSGHYRITARAGFYSSANSVNFAIGLYNSTDSVFETYTGSSGTIPIIGMPVYCSSPSSGTVQGPNMYAEMEGDFTITGTKTYKIYQKCSDQTAARQLNCCGKNTSMTGANVNSSAMRNVYMFVKIIKVA